MTVYYGVNPDNQEESIWFESPDELAEYLLDCGESLEDWECASHSNGTILFACSAKYTIGSIEIRGRMCTNSVKWPNGLCGTHNKEFEC